MEILRLLLDAGGGRTLPSPSTLPASGARGFTAGDFQTWRNPRKARSLLGFADRIGRRMVQVRLLTSAATRVGCAIHPVASANLTLVAAEVTRRIWHWRMPNQNQSAQDSTPGICGPHRHTNGPGPPSYVGGYPPWVSEHFRCREEPNAGSRRGNEADLALANAKPESIRPRLDTRDLRTAQAHEWSAGGSSPLPPPRLGCLQGIKRLPAGESPCRRMGKAAVRRRRLGSQCSTTGSCSPWQMIARCGGWAPRLGGSSPETGWQTGCQPRSKTPIRPANWAPAAGQGPRMAIVVAGGPAMAAGVD